MAAPILVEEMNLIYNGIDTNGAMTGGRVYQSKLSLGAGETSKAILIFQGNVASVLFDYNHAPSKVYGTLASIADIEAGNAVWEEITISGITEINIAFTAIYIVCTATPSTFWINSRCW